MALAAEAKRQVLAKNQTHKSDTGSPEVQIALLSGRILQLTEHFQANLAPIARVDKIWFPKEDVFLSTAKPDFSLVPRTAQSIRSRRAHVEQLSATGRVASIS